MMYYARIPSPLGKITIVSQEGFLTHLSLPGQPETDLTEATENPNEPVLDQTRQWLVAYFRGEAPAMTVPLAPAGSPFRCRVWNMLEQIPYGCTVTYGDLAGQFMGKAMSAQAVGQAVGSNPISILIPCHRVLGKGSTLTGYAGGLELKRFLLDLEGIQYRV